MSRREKFKKGISVFTGDVRRILRSSSNGIALLLYSHFPIGDSYIPAPGTSRLNTPSGEQSRANTPEVSGPIDNLEAGAIVISSAASTPASALVNPQPNNNSGIHTRPDESVPQVHLLEEDHAGVTGPRAEAPGPSAQPTDPGVDAPANRDPSNSKDAGPTSVDHLTNPIKGNRPNSAAGTAAQPSSAASTMRKGLKELVRVLGPVTGLFGPIKDLVTVIEGCVDTYEMAGAAKVEYDAMRVRLEATIEDLRRYSEEGQSLKMTTSMESICGSIRAELDKIRTKLEKNQSIHPLEAPDEPDSIMRSYQRIELDLHRLGLNTNWETMKDVKEQAASARIDRLSPSLSAHYNSAEADDELKRQACTPGTRIKVLDNILDWARNGDDGTIYWLNGMAGTGKTTIAYSVCERLQAEHKLAASFFCSRLREECRVVKRIIPSIAYQLAQFSLPIQSALSAALQKDRDIPSKSLRTQFEELIVNPLQATGDTLPNGLVIVIDALDECESKESTGRVLDILLNSATDLPVRFLVSSRPEAEIRDQMTDEQVKSRLVLHELEKGEVQADIETYLRVGLSPMKPSEEDIVELVARTGILFIYAATAVRYISYDNFRRDPGSRLRSILGSSKATATTKNREIDNLYRTVLESALDDQELDECERDYMQQVLHTVICAREPLTVKALSALLHIKNVDRVRAALRPMWSVLHVVGVSEFVTTLHASFPDFMFDSTRSKAYWCDSHAHHRGLAEQCFKLMAQAKPQVNICGLESSYLPDENVPDIEKRVADAISLGLLYACRYWADHVSAGNCAIDVVEQIHDFLSTRLLLWIEILNLKNQMKTGIECVKAIAEWCKDLAGQPELAELVLDAKRFVEAFASNPVCQSTPHIYVSMLPFWPKSAPIVKHYAKYSTGPVQAKGTALDRRQLVHLSTWAFEKPISEIAVSPDGDQVALVVGNDVLIVDSASGRVILGPLRDCTTGARAITFSPDGSRILAGSVEHLGNGATILGWYTRSGDFALGPLQICGHTRWINCLSISPDCSRIATRSNDIDIFNLWSSPHARTDNISLWDVQTGELLVRLQAQEFEWHGAIVFSPDGTRVAAGFGKTVQVWDSESGDAILRPITKFGSNSINRTAASPDDVRSKGITDMLCGHSRLDSRYMIALSSDNSRVICASAFSGIIQVGNIHSDGVVFRQIAENSALISCIAFSPDSKHIASGCDNRTVKMWDTETGNMVLGPLRGHTGKVNSVTFSPDGSRIISACEGGLVCTWDAQQHSPTRVSTNAPSHRITCVKFLPGGARFISGSAEGAVCIWDADTGGMAIDPIKMLTGGINAVDFKDDHVVLGSWDGEICVWDARTGEVVLSPFKVGSQAVRAVAYSPDGNLIATGSSDGVGVWNAQDSSRALGPLTDLRGTVSSVRFSPDGARVVASSRGYSSNIAVWGVSDGRNVFGTLDGHRERVLSVSYSPNGALIASGSADHTIIVWDASTGEKAVGPLTGHSDWVNSVSFSSNSTRFVSGSHDKTIRIWDVQTGEMLFELAHGHRGWIMSVEYSPDGTCILSRSFDGSVWTCDARTPEERAQLKFGNWTMNKDGWVVDDQSRLLVWVPGDLRNALLSPGAPIIVGERSFSLKFDESRMGEAWARSYMSEV